ncbi:hypothetical protein FHS82_000058 [Pseudochelatococcus lubricantis]|uniref:Uncharacterized protein n=1 Tax=Pseudochelatococcus lubricantis TaxID=1538102 RepID=A0ABX0UXB9_9HYPH|nr:hypothetical protein [Pseudochelatococcus lubricantis]NIJ56245.1 hypothetical protein [Pseudochelatococcus lubricantis]
MNRQVLILIVSVSRNFNRLTSFRVAESLRPGRYFLLDAQYFSSTASLASRRVAFRCRMVLLSGKWTMSASHGFAERFPFRSNHPDNKDSLEIKALMSMIRLFQTVSRFRAIVTNRAIVIKKGKAARASSPSWHGGFPW